MIPKIIWQTYKDPYDSLQPYMHDAINTWKNLNPEYEYRYMDDAEASVFILKYYGQDMLNLFNSFPVGVMRGDLWRYLIIHTFGGVYADLDTICHKPISTWMKDDYDMIVCPEHDLHYCQWAFAASPGNEVIKSVIDLIIERSKNIDYTKPHFVHYYTGPGVWSAGIRMGLGLPDEQHKCDGQPSDERCEHRDLILRSVSENELTKDKKFFCYGGENWRIFHIDAIQHIYGSQNWNEGYVKWIEDPLAKGSR